MLLPLFAVNSNNKNKTNVSNHMNLQKTTSTMSDDELDHNSEPDINAGEGSPAVKKDMAEKVSKQDKKDSNEDEEEVSSTANLFRIDSGLLPFPEKLMALLDSGEVSDSMWWLPDGDAFCLIPQVFAEKVLDKHFQGTKFESFTRKLNRWGFKRVAGQKVPTNTIAYYNKNFLRGKPKLLKNMNGGKTKFISAREKRVRAQLKRERDREQAVMIAAQQQALYANRLGMGAAIKPVGGGNFAVMQGAGGAMGGASLLSASSSQPLGFPQHSDDMRVAEQIFAAEQAIAAQQHREELQMRLLRASGAFGMQGVQGMPTMQDPRDFAASQAYFARGGFGQQFAGQGGFSAIPQIRRGSDDPGMSASAGELSAEQQFLLARQMAVGQNPMADRMMSQQVRFPAHGGTSSDSAAAKIFQQRMEEEKMMKTKAFLAQQGSPAMGGKPAEGQVDPQLFQLYLLEQQRKQELAMSVARQQQG